MDGIDDLDIAAQLGAFKNAVTTAPPGDVEARHLAAIVAAVDRDETPALPERRSVGWRRSAMTAKTWVLRTAAGVAALFGSTVGLAYAGVDLPGTAAERAVEATLGIELPNQAEPATDAGEKADTADDGDDEAARASGNSSEHRSEVGSFASDPDKEPGCEFGQSVRELAGEKAESHRQNESDGADPCDKGKAEGKGERKGKGGSAATGEQKSSEAREKAPPREPRGPKPKGEGDPPPGKGVTDEDKDTGKDRADDASTQGQTAREGAGDRGTGRDDVSEAP